MRNACNQADTNIGSLGLFRVYGHRQPPRKPIVGTDAIPLRCTKPTLQVRVCLFQFFVTCSSKISGSALTEVYISLQDSRAGSRFVYRIRAVQIHGGVHDISVGVLGLMLWGDVDSGGRYSVPVAVFPSDHHTATRSASAFPATRSAGARCS